MYALAVGLKRKDPDSDPEPSIRKLTGTEKAGEAPRGRQLPW
jgi:hypothetical protein